MHQYTLRAAQLESSLAKNTLVALVDTQLTRSQYCVPAAKKADGFPSTCQTTLGAPCPGLGSPVQGRHGHTGENQVMGQ